MLKKIEKWIANPKRSYAEGVGYFNRFASDKQKETFSRFFETKENEAIDQFDIRFTTLVNQILFVFRRIKSNPDLFIESKKETISPGKKPTTASSITLDSLPGELSAERDRLKEIVPVMAKLHADMADEKIADDKRAVIRAELVKLDDERRSIWDKIESAGMVVEKSEEEKTVETNMLSMGAQTALRIGQLKGYITRNQNALQKHIDSGNQKKADNAKEKIEMYSKELEELQKLLPDNEK